MNTSLTDEAIVQKFCQRDEEAITAVSSKYTSFCSSIAYHILFDREDTEECVNDTWLNTWNAIPPEIPRSLQAFLGRITRNLAINRLRSRNTQKRGGDATLTTLDEIGDCLAASADNVEQAINRDALENAINEFLDGLTEEKRTIFIRRYYFFDSMQDIARGNRLQEANVKVTLFRLRKQLKKKLEEEGLM